jgi:hypothetical protein
MRLFSDERGVATFYAQAIAEPDRARQLTLRCADDTGNRRSHPIVFQPGEAGSASVLAQEAQRTALEATPHPSATVLPALSAADADALTNDDIVRLGYPPRTNADRALGEHAHWLSLVSRPITVLPPRMIDNPGVKHRAAIPNGPASSSNWSGLVLTGTAGYGYVYGTYVVPKVATSGTHNSSFWVGLDGWNTGDVVQDGSEQDVSTFFWFQVSTYRAWVEYYPLNEQSLSLSIRPGHTIEAWTWMSNSSGYSGNTAQIGDGGYGWFYLYDATTGTATGFLSIKQPSNAPAFAGSSVEWIMERPESNGSITTLADYGTAAMSSLTALDWTGAAHSYQTDPYEIVTMMNGSDTLSTASVGSSGIVDFQWVSYQ